MNSPYSNSFFLKCSQKSVKNPKRFCHETAICWTTDFYHYAAINETISRMRSTRNIPYILFINLMSSWNILSNNNLNASKLFRNHLNIFNNLWSDLCCESIYFRPILNFFVAYKLNYPVLPTSFLTLYLSSFLSFFIVYWWCLFVVPNFIIPILYVPTFLVKRHKNVTRQDHSTFKLLTSYITHEEENINIFIIFLLAHFLKESNL